jgi:superfamily II DNA or RNA helicase
MAFNPRWYQNNLISGVRTAWSQGYDNILVVSPPRSGKTPMMVWISEPFINNRDGVFVNAHREELVRQIAMTFAEFGYNHNIIAPQDVIDDIIRRQHRQFGRSFYDQRSLLIVGSVQTMNARSDKLRTIAPRIKLLLTDETHHLLPDNQWGKAVALFPNAKVVGFTATPQRTDRKSLARSQGGMFDFMVKGVTARQLINEGYICDYRIIAPPASIDRSEIRTGKTGDFTKKGLSEAQHKSTITGDCVKSYLEHAAGTQAVVFAVDIQHAQDLTDAYVAAGIDAMTVSSKTPKSVRKVLMDKFERGVFKVLVNVDLFGEGLNVKGIETVIMARPTKSFVLYVQQFFRALTASNDKSMGTIIDHAGNVGYFGKLYGLPCSYNGWTLEDIERSTRKTGLDADDDVEPVTTCTECFLPYLAVLPQCPHCGHEPIPEERSAPEHVDGDLELLDVKVLMKLWHERDRIDGDPLIPKHLRNTPAEGAIQKRHIVRKEAQAALRQTIALWAGYWRDQGDADRTIHKRFYQRFGMDIATAQTFNEKDATGLRNRVDARLKHLMDRQ